jgi:hypothetical protein
MNTNVPKWTKLKIHKCIRPTIQKLESNNR